MRKFYLVLMMFLTVCSAVGVKAGSKEQLQQYFNDMAVKVKHTADPAQKRAIMNSTLHDMSGALNSLKQNAAVNPKDRAGIAVLEKAVADKQDELNGSNGYVRVQDKDLNNFADYTVQDMEQAETYVTISLVGLLLIVILVLLLSRG